MLKNILTCLLLVILISVAGVIGYTTLDHVMNAAPPVTHITSLCEVADGIGYRVIVQDIDISDAVGLYTEIRDLKRMGIKEVRFYINSPGGSLFDAQAIHDAIKRLSKDGIITVAEVEGNCMSGALLVAAACSYRIASKNCAFLIHKVSGVGDKDVLDYLCKRYVEILAGDTDLTAEEWRVKMNKQTWFTAEEALEWGLVDEIR